ncbi:hypothetical protein ACFE04_001798 [Oxalis oulophora]
MVSDQEIAKGVETVLRQSDPNSVTSLNGVVQQLEVQLGLDLSHKAGFIRDQINFLLRSPPITTQPQPRQQQQQQQHNDQFALQQQLPPQQQFFSQPHFMPHFALHPHHQQQHHQPFPHDLNFRQPTSPHQMAFQHQQPLLPRTVHRPPPVLKSEATPHQNVTVSTEVPKESAPAKRRGGPGGLNKVCGVSPELQVIVGQPAMPRTEIVKQLWAYIRKNSLQDPSNKRKIICDDALRLVLEVDCTDMFKMNKLLSKHIIKLEPSKVSSQQAKRLKVDSELTTESTEPGTSPPSGPSPIIISEALAKFFGTEEREMLQTEAEGRVSEYIKINSLEDPMNSMVILCDEKLHELLGCESISAIGIPQLLTRHHFFRRS